MSQARARIDELRRELEQKFEDTYRVVVNE